MNSREVCFGQCVHTLWDAQLSLPPLFGLVEILEENQRLLQKRIDYKNSKNN
jgi:hypothetical protein